VAAGQSGAISIAGQRDNETTLALARGAMAQETGEQEVIFQPAQYW
jgi:hypothetical protein